jgi:hypothetical protein
VQRMPLNTKTIIITLKLFVVPFPMESSLDVPNFA